ncbi:MULTISPECIES: FAD-binding oxidoreductase [Streptomyces]|uniref:FAD-binding oxidoreductase n=1 Tax=Streptomyces coacervatus TaxID=647381 RepID=A0ABP7JCM9_9ACTN|nr:FAD-binding oxidoreductase [Streptomyces coacervatus]MDF2264295.1 FAD-binding oxidoreductase [Streptomyces coacervatus]
MSDPVPFELPDAVRDEFVAVVGRDNALVTDEERDEYRDPYWPTEDRTYDSSLVLFPTTTEQVQDIVRVANRHEVPVWASSQGRNNGYGGPSARVKGSVLISFRKMDRVLEVDTELAYAVVEPGARWYDLYDVLHEQGDELLVSVPDIGWGSVIGNSLDNGQTFLPNGSDFNTLNGLEVVLADGSLLRTGFGAQEDNPTWHLYKRGLGPVVDPLFAQSNYGIVTKAGVWLQRRPKAYAPLYLSVPRYHQLAQVIDVVRELRLDGILRGIPYVLDLLTVGDAHFPEFKGRIPPPGTPAMPEERLDAIADETGLGRWGVRTALWGDPEVIDVHERRIREAWSAIEGGEVRRLATYTAENWHEIKDAGLIDRISGGVPSSDILDSLPDFVGHVGFSPVVPLRGEEVAKVVQQIKDKVVERTGVNFSAQVFVTNERSAIVVSAMFFNRHDAGHLRATIDTAKELLVQLGQQGYAEYRSHLDFSDLAQDQLAFGDHAYRRFAETIKDAVDPKGILSPGRHGIWPARYRAR